VNCKSMAKRGGVTAKTARYVLQRDKRKSTLKKQGGHESVAMLCVEGKGGSLNEVQK